MNDQIYAMKSSRFNPGQQIDQYILREEIASGGMGEVWLAFQESMNRLVAIKFLPEVDKDNSDTVARFDREIHMISHLEHPHIVPVYGFGEAMGNPYIVMRHMNGGTLRDQFQDGKLNLRRIMAVVDQIITAIDYAHQQGIIHRDIKPSNVFLDERENAYLADFGLAKTVSGSYDLTRTDEGISGTPEYMSPEQVRGLKLDGRTDIYSVGIIVFQLLSGHPPFSGQNPMDTVLKQISDPVPSIRAYQHDLPKAVDHVFQRVLSKDVSERYDSGREFYNALEDSLASVDPAWLPQKVSGAVSTEPETVPNTHYNGSDEKTVENMGRPPGSRPFEPKKDVPVEEDTTIQNDYIEIPTLTPRMRRIIVGVLLGMLMLAAIAYGVVRLVRFLNDPLANVDPDAVARVDAPRGLSFDENGSVWVISSETDEVYELRTECEDDLQLCGSIVSQAFVNSRPQFTAVGDGEVFIGHQFASGLIAINTVDKSMRNIEFSQLAADAVVAGGRLWVTADDSLLEMDLDGNLVAEHLAGRGITEIHLTQSGLWVALVGDGAFVRRFDFAARSFDEPVRLSGTSGQIISLDGIDEDNRLWVSLNRDNLLYQLDATTGEIIGSEATSDLPLDIEIYEDLVFVAARGESLINVFDAKEGTFLSSINGIDNPDSLIVEPCGDSCAKLWVASEIGDLVYTVEINPLP